MGLDAINRLTAWNEGDTDSIPHGYDHDSLDWQTDLRHVLKITQRVGEIVAKEAETWGPANEGKMYWATGRHLAECKCSTDGARAMLHDIVHAMEYERDEVTP